MSKVLVIGGGGREHALAYTLACSAFVQQVYVAPGNGGTHWAATDSLAPCETVALAPTDSVGLLEFALNQNIDLTVVGPESALAIGIVDVFQAAGLSIFGPTQAAAQLETSKAFAKNFMQLHGIPTPAYQVFDDFGAALTFVQDFQRPLVVKADGLAAGKGVILCNTTVEAEVALRGIMLEQRFGKAGAAVVIEEQVQGREFSVLAFSDGQMVVPMPVARDHKRAYDGDTGPNTGGMGAFAPTPDIDQATLDDVCRHVLQPTIDGIAARGTPYVGVLYAGLMQNTDGTMQVLEFNCRFGDPETQVILPLLATDLYPILQACIGGYLNRQPIDWHDGVCATVVLASGGYPLDYRKGLLITGLEDVPSTVQVFHAGTRRQGHEVLTTGGRVLAVTARGDSLRMSLEQIYQAIGSIQFEGMHYRRDIGEFKT